MKPKRGETLEQTIDRWAHELLTSTTKRPVADLTVLDYDWALELVDFLKARINVLKVHNT